MKMFEVDTNSMAIRMHKGDTGAFYVTLELEDNEEFVQGDTAIFEVWQGTTRLMHREFDLQPDEPDDIELGDGKFLIAFRNSDTDTWSTTAKNTEIRVSLNPVRSSKLKMTVNSDATAEVDEETCLDAMTAVSGTKTLTYTTEWSENPSTYGITVTGTPTNGDTIVLQWDKNATEKVVDGDTVRTIVQSTINIKDVLIDI